MDIIKRTFIHLSTPKEDLHEYIRNQIADIDENDIIHDLETDPDNSLKYWIVVEKIEGP